MAKKKKAKEEIYRDNQWTVRFGELNPGRGRPETVKPLFLVVGEKLPFEALGKVSRHLQDRGIKRTGVYMAHDSMGCARYVGRGAIFPRLRSRLNAQELELKYFSFYVVKDRKHEREIETLLIRAAGPLLQFNTKKKRLTISVGRIGDYEGGTMFFERLYKKGKKLTNDLTETTRQLA